MKNLARYISIGLIASLTSCKDCDGGYKPPKKEVEICTNNTKVNFKEAEYNIYALVPGLPKEFKGTVTFDTTDALTGIYTSTYADLGARGTYTKDCSLSRIKFNDVITWQLESHTKEKGKYYYLSDGCLIIVPQGGLLTGESKYSLEIIK